MCRRIACQYCGTSPFSIFAAGCVYAVVWRQPPRTATKVAGRTRCSNLYFCILAFPCVHALEEPQKWNNAPCSTVTGSTLKTPSSARVSPMSATPVTAPLSSAPSSHLATAHTPCTHALSLSERDVMGATQHANTPRTRTGRVAEATAEREGQATVEEEPRPQSALPAFGLDE